MADDKRRERREIGRNVGQLVRQTLALQIDAQRICEAEKNASRGDVKGVVAPKHHRDDRDPSPPGAHILGKYADSAERQLRAREPGQRPRDEHRDDSVAGDVDAQRLGCVGLFANAANLRPTGVLNKTTLTSAVSAQATQVKADCRPNARPRTGTPDERGNRDPRRARTTPGSLKPPLTPNVPQEIGRQTRREEVHPDADDDRIAAKDRRAIG